MAKKIMGYIKLELKAGSATMQPPVGPAFGQRGLAGINFVKEFNARTGQMEKGIPIPVVVTYYQDKSFSFEMKNPPVSHYLKRAAGLTSASKTPGRGGFVGKVTKTQVREIAETKIKDLNCDSVDSAMSMIEGSARSMGLQVVE